MADRYYIVELRCGSCGIVFAAATSPVREDKVEEYEKMFLAKGPEKFVQCKGGCTRMDPKTGLEVPGKNLNLRVIKAQLGPEELN